jgi:hypothetical protein
MQFKGYHITVHNCGGKWLVGAHAFGSAAGAYDVPSDNTEGGAKAAALTMFNILEGSDALATLRGVYSKTIWSARCFRPDVYDQVREMMAEREPAQ